MSAIISLSIDVTKIDKSKLVDGKYLNTQIFINDETKFTNNVSMCYSQSKEERDNKTKKEYFANGKVVWTDNVIKVADKEDKPAQESKQEVDSLPF